MEIPKGLAAGIADARLAVVEGDTGTPASNDVEDLVRTIDEFLGVEPAEAAAVEAREKVRELGRLTERETEVLRLVAGGESNKEIAGVLGLSVHTVERHLANIYAKLEVRGRAEATAIAVRSGLA